VAELSREALAFAAEVIRARFRPRGHVPKCHCGAPMTRGHESPSGVVSSYGCDTHAPDSPPLRSLATLAEIERALGTRR